MTTSRDAWVRAFEAATRRLGQRARLRVTLINPAAGAASFCAVALRLTTTGTGAEDVVSVFGRSDVEALDALVEELKARGAPKPAGSETT